MKPSKEEIDNKCIVIDLNKFEIEFECIDKTPWGKSLWRIEWHIEPVYKLWICRYIYVRPSQTRDRRIAGKIWKLVCNTPSFEWWSLSIKYWNVDKTNSYFLHVRKIWYCKLHRMTLYSAYPKDWHSKIVFENLYSSVYSSIYFK